MGPWQEVVAFQIQAIPRVYILCENGQAGTGRVTDVEWQGQDIRLKGSKARECRCKVVENVYFPCHIFSFTYKNCFTNTTHTP